ncbi:RNA exonuclease 1 homolog [Colias croceus]|uniref:RNA exonuclease 1 homolog n=1 Tax=Colias crocea TaxID=72248 RepID=UPI001E2802FD|nr:RNA exonuclease 1 homolog [Colias croceus]
MLPSTGYFKGIICPFYDTGLCERPYCHFRHVKKDPQNVNGDGIESGEILQKLVSAAVQKVLRQNDSSLLPSTSQKTTDGVLDSIHQLPVKATYSPTPISELNKINNEVEADEAVEKKRRHIPVPYTPRKPAALQIKRPIDTNGSKLYVAPVIQYTPGSESAQLDPYTPKGTVESNEKYKPGTEAKIQEYLPNETHNTNTSSNKHNYVPSDKYTTKSKIIEYKPTNVTKSVELPVIKYQPTPKSLVPCFSSDEEEPDLKKQKISNDLNGFDDLGPEFDILDQILDEENTKDEAKPKEKHNDCKENKSDKNRENVSKLNTHKNDKIKSGEKDSKQKDSKQYDKQDKKYKDSDRKSSHKSSHSDKSKEKIKKEDKSNKKSHSSSKSSEHHSKSSSSDKRSKHSKSSSRHNEKNIKSSKESKEDTKKSEKHHKSHKRSKENKDNSKRKKREKSASRSISENDNDHCDGLELLESEVMSESDEETIAEECKRIFEEYVPESKPKNDQENCKQEAPAESEEYIPTKKRISRTVDKNIKVVARAPVKPDFKLNAAQVMAERLSKVKQFHVSKNEQEQKNIPVSNIISKPESSVQFSTPTSSKIRIAHVPYASTLLTAKKTMTSNNVTKPISQPSTSFTSIQTVKKGVQRVAHIPNDKFIDRPGVLEPLGSKIPANIRSTYLNLMIDQTLKIYLSSVDAYARAQHEELTSSKKCSTVPIYKNSAVLAISRLKKEILECNGVKKSGMDCATLQKMPNAMEQSNSAGSWSIESRSKKTYDDRAQYTGAKLYNNIKKWILTEEQLRENGFPRPHENGEKGRAIIYGQNKQKPPKGFIRTCCRCKKDYTVNKKGFPSVKEECIYHPNNKYRVRGEVRYQCCSQDGSSDGCCIAESHVYEYVDFENLKGYVKTLPPEKEMDDYGVYSLDCEMCYTTQGLDLTRVTVINSSCKVIYETLIKPLHPIIDYNTRYSGITEEQMSHVKTTLLEVQATLLTMFNSKTILIGHSLESDFKALKLIHDTVIDTSVLFPHKMGPPYKRALRNLSSEYLKKIIQNSVDGHDSAEDATVCMELLHFKLKEDLKTR